MQPQVRLGEEERMNRRTVADALEVVREERRGEQIVAGRFEIAMMELPSKEWTALVDVVFPELGCRVRCPRRLGSAPDQGQNGDARSSTSLVSRTLW